MSFYERYVGSVVRHALTALGGALVVVGVEEAQVSGLVEAAVPVVAGVVSYGIGQALSILEKKARRAW